MAQAKLQRVREKEQQIMTDNAARDGKTIGVGGIRRRLEGAKATYVGPDREAYVQEIDRLLESLAVYGDRIPVILQSGMMPASLPQ